MSNRDPKASERAVDTALRLLARRPLTEAELRTRLEVQGHAGDVIDEICARMREARYLDDDRLALEFIVARAERLRHGPGRLIAELCRRGVAPEVARAAWRLAVERDDIEPLELLRRRLRSILRGAAPPLGEREYARVYNALRRAGFDEDAIREELDSFGRPASHTEPITDETTDDFP